MTPVLYCDMDGVISQFAAGAIKHHGKSLDPLEIRWDFCSQIGFNGTDDPAFWGPLAHKGFWENLEVHTDGMEVLRWADRTFGHNLALLTSPADGDGCYDGKKAWVKKHLPAGYHRRMFAGLAKHLVGARDKVLLDDYEGNVTAYRKGGNPAVLAPRPWNYRIGECNPDGSFDPATVIADLERALSLITDESRGCLWCQPATS